MPKPKNQPKAQAILKSLKEDPKLFYDFINLWEKQTKMGGFRLVGPWEAQMKHVVENPRQRIPRKVPRQNPKPTCWYRNPIDVYREGEACAGYITKREDGSFRWGVRDYWPGGNKRGVEGSLGKAKSAVDRALTDIGWVLV